MKRYLRTLSDLLTPVGESGWTHEVAAGTSMVLGSANNYEVDDVKAFVTSLRRHYDGRVVIVIDGDNLRLRDFLHRQNVEAIIADELFIGVEARVELVRYAYFLLLARRQSVLPEQVLLTDTRDVLFQAPPFPAMGQHEIRYFTEADDVWLAEHPTGKWIASTFDQSVARRLAERPCICCGTMYVHGRQLVPFLTLLLSLAAIPRYTQAQSFGIDQAIVNYIGHFGLVGQGEICGNFGTVATIGLIPPEKITIDSRGQIFNPDGTQSALVHQYDRHPNIWADVLQRYGLSSTRRMREAEADKNRTLAHRLSHLAWAITRRIPEPR